MEYFFETISDKIVGAEIRKKILEGIDKRITRQQKFAASLTQWFQAALENLRC